MTLPEGATVSILRCRTKSGGISTYLSAAQDRNRIEMTVDNIAPGSLDTYLKLMVREIQRERAKLTEKPKEQYRLPHTIKEFVLSMAFLGMFIFGVMDNVNFNGNKRIPKSRSKVSK